MTKMEDYVIYDTDEDMEFNIHQNEGIMIERYGGWIVLSLISKTGNFYFSDEEAEKMANKILDEVHKYKGE